MPLFPGWFNDDGAGADIDGVLKAGLAHLWFLTIHPFDDGNGRVARAVADLALAGSEQSDQRFYSMSAQICRERAAYYDMLGRTQKGTLDVTPWMEWFLACLGRAIDGAQTTLAAVFAKARFWLCPGASRSHNGRCANLASGRQASGDPSHASYGPTRIVAVRRKSWPTKSGGLIAFDASHRWRLPRTPTRT